MASAALQRRNPDFVRLEVDLAGADPERFAHPAPGQRQRSGKRLDGRFGAAPDRGEEAGALFGREVLPAAVVDQDRVGRRAHGSVSIGHTKYRLEVHRGRLAGRR